MLSEFGKFSRKLRIEKDELLIDMAQKLDVKPSFLSAVEMGRKGIPNSWEQKLINLYDLDENQQNNLKQAIQMSAKELKINLSEKNNEDKNLLLAFARKLDNLDTNEKISILKILDDNEDKHKEG